MLGDCRLGPRGGAAPNLFESTHTSIDLFHSSGLSVATLLKKQPHLLCACGQVLSLSLPRAARGNLERREKNLWLAVDAARRC